MRRKIMRRFLRTIRRTAFNLLALCCLFLCAGIVAMWADSYREMRMIETRRGSDVAQWASRDGVAVLYWNRGADGEFRWQRPTQRFQILGLSYVDGRLVRRKPWSMLVVPYWMPAMLLTIVPVAWVVKRSRDQLRRHRQLSGLCLRCGARVDARGNCPACSPANATSVTRT